VYLILVLHGIGILMPWNMFINAKSVSGNSILKLKVYYYVQKIHILILVYIKNVINLIVNKVSSWWLGTVKLFKGFLNIY